MAPKQPRRWPRDLYGVMDMTRETFDEGTLRRFNRGALCYVHPDRSKIEKDTADDMRVLITVAQWALGDADRRKVYDAMLRCGKGELKRARSYEAAARMLQDKIQCAIDIATRRGQQGR
jgi:DnaJ-class molecular chaperone